jgi:hypothetical protein
MFEWVPVESSAMTAIGYDAETETVYVRFKEGKEWWYSACPQNVWNDMRAPGVSLGKFLHSTLYSKPNGPYVV